MEENKDFENEKLNTSENENEAAENTPEEEAKAEENNTGDSAPKNPKKKNKSGKKKLGLRGKIILSVATLFTVVVAVIGIYFIVNIFGGKQAEIEDTEAKYSTTLKEAPKDGSDPSDYSLEDNVAYSLWVFSTMKEFWTLTEGTADASVATVQVYNKRVVKDDKAMITMISSGIVKSGKQKYFIGLEDGNVEKVLLRDATKVSIPDSEWYDGTPECITYESYNKRYGWLPNQATGYIICHDTYTNVAAQEIKDNGDGTYTLVFDLDPAEDKAPFWYRREVLTNGSSAIVPVFYSIHFEMTIDKDWHILIDDISEQYKVKSAGVEAVTKTHCVENFHYDGAEFDKDAEDYFESYSSMTAVTDDTEAKVDPMSVIVGSLQNADGSDKNLKLSVSYGEFETEALASLNISDLENIKVVAALKDLYVEYGDSLYISIGGVKAKVNINDITDLIAKITEALPESDEEASSEDESSAIDVSAIMADLSASVMEEDATGLISMDTTLHLGDITIPIHFIIQHNGEDSYSLIKATVTLTLNGKDLVLTLDNTEDAPEVMDHSLFSDVKNLSFITDEVLEALNNKSIDFDLGLTYSDFNASVTGNVTFTDAVEAYADIKLSNTENELSLSVAYIGDTVYVTFGNIKLGLTKDDLTALIKKYTGDSSIDLSSIDIEAILTTVFSLDYNTLLDHLYMENDSMELQVGLSELTDKLNSFKLSLKKEEYGLSGTVSLDDFDVTLKAGTLGYLKPSINSDEYQNLVYLEGLVDDILVIVKNKNTGFDVTLSYDDITATLNGDIDFSDSVKVYADVNVSYNENSLDIQVTYINDTIYLDMEGIRVQVTLDELFTIISKFTGSEVSLDSLMDSGSVDVKSILDTVLAIDFDKLLESLTISEEETELKVNLGALSEKLSSLSVKLTTKDGLKADISYSDIKATLSITDYEAVNVPIEEYNDLVYLEGFADDIMAIISNKNTGFDATLTYDDITVTLDGNVDFADDIKVNASLRVSYNEKSLDLDVTYINGILYISVENINLKISLDDLISMVKEYTGTEISLDSLTDSSSLDIKSVLETVLAIDFEALVESFKIDETDTELKLNLAVLSDKLSELSVKLTAKDGLKADIAYDSITLALSLTAYEEVTEPIDEYNDLVNLKGLVNNILLVVKNKNTGFKATLSYDDIYLDIEGSIDFNDSIKAKASVSVSYNEKSLALDVSYINDTIYFDTEGIKIKVTLDELLKIVSEFTDKEISLDMSMDTSSLDIKSILDTVLAIDFDKLVESFKVDENDTELKLNLTEISDKLSELSLKLTTEDGLKADVSYDKIQASLELCDYTEVTKPEGDYNDVANLEGLFDNVLLIIKNKQTGFILNVSYEDIMVTGNGSLDFNDSIKAKVSITITYNENTLTLNVTYINDTIYLDTEGIKLQVTLDELLKIISQFTGKEISLDMDTSSLDIKSILDTVLAIDFDALIEAFKIDETNTELKLNLAEISDKLSELSLKLTTEDGLKADISYDKINASLALTDYEEVTVPDGDYNDVIYLDGILDTVLAIVKDKKTGFKATISYLDIEASLTGSVDFSDGIKAKADITVTYNENSLDLHVNYINDTIYLDAGSVKVKVTLEEVLKIVSEFTGSDVSLDTSSIDVKSILDTVLSMDLASLIQVFKITEENTELGLNLGVISESLQAISLVLSKDDTLQADISYDDIRASLMLMDAEEITEPTDSYNDLADLDNLFTEIKKIIDNKNLGLTVNASYKDITITGEVSLDFNDGIKANADITLTSDDDSLALDVVYINDTIYLETSGIRIKVTLEEILKIVSEFTGKEISLSSDSLDIKSILETVLSIDFDKLIETFGITENELALYLDLSAVKESLKKLSLLLNTEDGILVTASYDTVSLSLSITDYTEVTEPIDNYNDVEDLDEIISKLAEMIEDKKLSLDLDLKYKEFDISGTALVDFSDGIKAYVSLDATYKDTKIPVSLTYINDMAYLDILGYKLKISKDNLLEIIGEFTGSDVSLDTSSIDIEGILKKVISLDFDALIEEFEITEDKLAAKADLSVLSDSLKKLGLVLSLDDDIQVNASYDEITAGIKLLPTEDEVLVPEGEYQDLYNLKSVIDFIKHVLDSKEIAVNASLSFKDVNIAFDAVLDFKDDLKVKADAEVSYKGLDVALTVYYFKTYNDLADVILIDLNENHIMVKLSDLPLGESDTSSILDTVFSYDFEKILASLVILETTDITLDLSDIEALGKILDNPSEIGITLGTEDGELKLTTINLMDLAVTASVSDTEITAPSYTYTDMAGMISDIMELVGWINKESIRIDLEGKASIKNVDLTLSGYADLIYSDDTYSVDGYMNLLVSGTVHDIYFEYVNKTLYLSYGGIHIGIDMTNIKDFITEVTETLGLSLGTDFDFGKLNSVVDSIIIGEESLGVDLSSLTDIIGNILLSISYEEGDLELETIDEFNASITSDEKINVTAKATKISSHEITVPDEYLDNDDILTLCKTLKKIIDLKDERSFKASLDLSIYDNNLKHLDITGDITVNLATEEWKDFKLSDLSLYINAKIVEYNEDGATIKVTHRIELTLTSTGLYIVYGNNESDTSSKIKLYTKPENIFDIVADILPVFGIDTDLLDEFKTEDLDYVDLSFVSSLLSGDSDESSSFNVSDIIASLAVSEGRIEALVKASAVKSTVPDEDMIDAVIDTNDGNVNITVSGLYTDYVSEAENTLLTINSVTVGTTEDTVSAPSNTSGYYDISGIDKLVFGLLTDVGNKSLALSGDVELSIASLITITVPVEAKVEITKDNDPVIYVHMSIPKFSAVLFTLTKKEVYYYYKDGYVYIDRKDSSSGDEYQLKVTYQEFFDDIMYYLLDFGMGMPDMIMSAITSSSSDDDSSFVVDAGDVINSYSQSGYKYTVSLDMEALTGNSNLGDMALSLNLCDVGLQKDEDGTVHSGIAFSSVTDFSFELVSVIDLKADSLDITNFETKDSLKWFTDVDMSEEEAYIDSYEYGTDLIYKNQAYSGKRSHTITFIMNHTDNTSYSAASGAAIVFPSYTVVLDTSDNKYYLFTGWYSDKYCKNAFTSTSMPEKSMKLYAGWKEVSYYSLNVISLDGDVTYSLYNGEETASYLSRNVYKNTDGKLYILNGYSETSDGDYVDLDVMPSNDVTLYAHWSEITYKLYIDDVYSSDVTESLSIARSLYLKAGMIYFGFEADEITYNTLINLYGDYAVVSDGVGYIYMYTSVPSDFYTVTLDYTYSDFEKLYDKVSLSKASDFDSSYLPSASYNNMKINYWYNDLYEYNYGNISTMAHEDITLKAYYYTDYFTYGTDASNGDAVCINGYTYTDSTVITLIFPKYVVIDGEYQVLETIMINVDESDNKTSVFSGMNNFSAIYFNDGFKSIGNNCFLNCNSLKNVYLSDTVTSIASDAFYYNASSTFSTNAGYAESLRFNFSTSSSITSSSFANMNILACKWNSSKKYYGNKYSASITDWGATDLRNAYQNYSGSLRDLVHALV